MTNKLPDEPAHALYSPSGSPRWLKCTASINLVKKLYRTMHVPDNESIYAAEGTSAHMLLEHCLKEHHPDAKQFIGRRFYTHVVDDEMAESVNSCLAEAQFVCDTWGVPYSSIKTERKVYMPTIHPTDCFGTVDITILDPDNKRFAILDLKYGKGVRVTSDTTQLKMYGIGVLDSEQNGWLAYDRAYLGILQPRLEDGDMGWDEDELVDPQSDKVTMVWELEQLADEYAKIVEDIENGNGTYSPSEDTCRWCKGAELQECAAYDEMALSVITTEFADVKTTLSLTEKLDKVKQLRDWCNKVESAALASLVEDQGSVDGYKLVRGRTFRKWEDEEVAAEELAELIPPDQVFTKKIVSPAQAEKKIPKSHRGQIAHLIVQPEGKLSIAPVSDRRPAVVLDDNAEFGDV